MVSHPCSMTNWILAGALAICRGHICLGWLHFRFLAALFGLFFVSIRYVDLLCYGTFIYLGCVPKMLYKFRYHLKWGNRKLSSCEFYSVFCGYYVPSPKLNIAPDKTTFPFGARPICRGELLNCMEFTLPRCSMGLEYLPTFKIYHRFMANVCKYSSPMEHMDFVIVSKYRALRPSFSPWSLLAARKWPPQASTDVTQKSRRNLPWELIQLMEEIPNNLGCIKPCRLWDKLPVHWLAGFLNHQQYGGWSIFPQISSLVFAHGSMYAIYAELKGSMYWWGMVTVQPFNEIWGKQITSIQVQWVLFAPPVMRIIAQASPKQISKKTQVFECVCFSDVGALVPLTININKHKDHTAHSWLAMYQKDNLFLANMFAQSFANHTHRNTKREVFKEACSFGVWDMILTKVVSQKACASYF